jgi:murein DD-endopeptidase MepM/ murein hydrolase activator NlpD
MRAEPGAAPRGRPVSRALTLQILFCGVLAWAWWQGTALFAPSHRESELALAAGFAAAVPLTGYSSDTALGANVIEVIVGRNDTLDGIFRRFDLDLADLAQLRALPELRQALDRLHPGEALTLFHREGSLTGFERQLSESERLEIERRGDRFEASILDNPLERETATARGTITSSLFEAARVAGIADATAIGIADIFAWDIDFVLDVREGDAFVVTYERLSQDGEYRRDGPILAVEFVNQGRPYRAVRYATPGGSPNYYTPDGHSLKKAFLRAPVEFSRISSRFNPSRRHPVLNKIRAHKGVDYAAPSGTPVRAAGDGRVKFRGVKGGYGKVVELSHAGGVTTLYGHLSRFGKNINAGQRVSQGQVIGYVGRTGLATGPHLHYEYRVNGVHKDPQRVKLPNAQPISAAYKPDFLARTAPLLATLVPGAPGSPGGEVSAAAPAEPPKPTTVTQTSRTSW